MNDLRAAATAGDTQALAQLMNASFRPKGINVKVARSSAVLKVLMEGDRLPDRKMAGAVRKGLDGIKPQGIEKVILKAQSSGGKDSWIEQWSLSTAQSIITETNLSSRQESSLHNSGNGKTSLKHIFPAFQALIIFFFAFSIALLLIVLSDSTWTSASSLGISVILLATTFVLLYWSLLTQSGKRYASRYNRKNANPSTSNLMRVWEWYISGFQSQPGIPFYKSPALLRVVLTLTIGLLVVAPVQSLLDSKLVESEVAVSQEEAAQNKQPSCTQAAGRVYADVRLYRDAQCTQPFATVVGGGKLSDGQRGVLIKFDTGEMEWKTRDAVITQAYIRSNDPAVDTGLWRDIDQ